MVDLVRNTSSDIVVSIEIRVVVAGRDSSWIFVFATSPACQLWLEMCSWINAEIVMDCSVLLILTVVAKTLTFDLFDLHFVRCFNCFQDLVLNRSQTLTPGDPWPWAKWTWPWPKTCIWPPCETCTTWPWPSLLVPGWDLAGGVGNLARCVARSSSV